MTGNQPMKKLAVAIAIIGLAATTYLLRPAANPENIVQDETTGVQAPALPRLLDLGADKCVPCKMMAPILDKMKKDYAGTMVVEFIDVWKNPAAAEPYGIKVIPTQIFFLADGTELFRHEGFYSREDILSKWRELGVVLPEKGV